MVFGENKQACIIGYSALLFIFCSLGFASLACQVGIGRLLFFLLKDN